MVFLGRFYLVQIGPVAVISCGLGAGSLGICLEEMTKLLVDSGAFMSDEENESLSYNTSYVEYILLISAPGVGIGPPSMSAMSAAHRRRKSLSTLDSLMLGMSPSMSRSGSGSSIDRSRSSTSTSATPTSYDRRHGKTHSETDLSALKSSTGLRRTKSASLGLCV